ncbi:MAG: hypothetical protein ACFCUR_13160 [Rhodomicrobiaceae bacterium]
MDPDMVRQQEEAEEESRLRRLAPVHMPPPRPAPAPPAPADSAKEPMVLRAEPRGIAEDAPASGKTAPPRVGWFAALRAGIYSLIMTTLGLLAGIMIGVRTGLFPSQSLAIGAGLGLLLGWQAVLVSLRANAGLSFRRALLASLLPGVLMLVSLIGGMLAAAYFTGVTPETIADGHLPSFWVIVGVGGLTGIILAAMRMRKVARR